MSARLVACGGHAIAVGGIGPSLAAASPDPLVAWRLGEDPGTRRALKTDPALLPLAPLAATTEPEALLQQVAAQVGQIESDQRCIWVRSRIGSVG
ncbi:hypothetical protein OOK60_04025 [Trichothermofontia sichuanensis B231]|uniref:hypothetical protein n=1 Tax=Trichothermofontia sichuanensis TaxID=3045816 RepID=UPI002246AEE1|nr:hypothetical protein [Trichothermofontia sichuanensis]UZQ55253.1 hypothetical protein OOK60_04025 [Trichothermofontia sichuanensis B231]